MGESIMLSGSKARWYGAHRVLAGMLVVLIGFCAGNVAAAGRPLDLNIVHGKYNQTMLGWQYNQCNGNTCAGCMAEMFPDVGILGGNPFVDRSGPDCEGIKKYMNYAHWIRALLSKDNGDWVVFSITGTRKTVIENLVAQCQQRYRTDLRCQFQDQWGSHDVWGAYLIGSEENILDWSPFWDQGSLGPPPFDMANPYEQDLAEMRPYVDALISEYGYGPVAWNPWGSLYEAAQLWRSDLLTSTGPPANSASMGGGMVVHEFSAKVALHCLVAWQSWEGGRFEKDMLTPLGIQPLPDDDPWQTPTFIYWIKRAFPDLEPFTAIEVTTWGRIKALYRDDMR